MPTTMNSIATATNESVKALYHGGKVGVVDEINKRILSIAKKALGGKFPDFIETEYGENIALVFTAYILLFVTEMKLLPKSEVLSTAATLALEAKGRDIFQPFINEVLPEIDKLAELVEKHEAKGV